MTSQPLSVALKRSLERSAETYHAQIDDAARAYLDGRGLGAPSIETHRLGVVRDPIKGEERFRGRLAIPYIGPKGNVYGINYRCMEDHNCKDIEGHAKYDKPAGIPSRMFNTQALLAPTDYLFVTEGEIDAISVTACGWPAVGMPGANVWKGVHARMVAGFSKVVLLQDPDDAGSKLAATFLRSLPQSARVKMCEYREARDFNDILSKYGHEGVLDFFKEGE